MKETKNMLLFVNGWPSQWTASPFKLDGHEFNCCEQYMMWRKAVLFKDEESQRKILATPDPRKQKGLGRKVKNYNDDAWKAVCREVVYQGNLAKFSQNEDLKRLLLATGDKLIVEAAHYDKIWGIGLSEDDPRALDKSKWQGSNWLGEAIMRVRATLVEHELQGQKEQ